MPTKAHTRGTLGKLVSALSLVLMIASPSIFGHDAAQTRTAQAAVRATSLVASPAAAPGGTIQDFGISGQGTPYVVAQHLPPPSPAPAVIDGGPTGSGKMLRLAFGSATTPIPNHNSIAFERADPGAAAQVVADFDFRIAPRSGRADGMGFALLNTAIYDIAGAVAPHLPPHAAEEPNFTGSLGIGFDVYWTNPPPEINNNHISIHFNGALVREFDAAPAVDLGGDQWIHARIILRPGGGNSDVTVILAQCGRPPVTVVDRFKVPGLTPYESRAYFAARSGGLTSDQDIDNVHVQSLSATQNPLAFRTGCATALESDGQLRLTVERASSAGVAATVKYATSDLTAKAGLDYTATTGTLTFGPNEIAKTLSIPILNDALVESDEHFQVILSDATGGAVLGGPAIVNATIVGEKAARPVGHWSEPFPSQVVPIHMHVLPNGQVMYWDRHDDQAGWDGNPRIWDPTTGVMSSTEMLDYDIFCAGHSFLEDGRLLVTGGHIPLKAPDSGVGDDEASIYDPSTNTWERLPRMNAGRWYPSNVTLADGDVLVVGGTYLTSTEIFTPALKPVLNTIPQVFDTASKTWRTLSTAEQGPQPEWADYYPFLYVASDGKVFNAGPQQVARYLDTKGTGAWTDVATSTEVYRDYGSSVMYDEDKVLIVGGNERDDDTPTIVPSASAEVIELTPAQPKWRSVAPMHFGRRQLNTTLLPDGTVLATGGSSKPGFDEPTGAVLQAELWNPATEQWSVMAAQTRYRGYHSTAALLPDGRVLVGGGGHPDPAGGTAQANFEIYSPPYLFKGPRPRISIEST